MLVEPGKAIIERKGCKSARQLAPAIEPIDRLRQREDSTMSR
jgi:hypothetical protein